MPELPEAEAARARLESGALHRTIAGFALGEVTHMDLPDEASRERLMGTQFTRTRRHGKYIFIGSVDGPWLHIHLGMSGSLRVMDAGDELPDYIRLTVEFEGDRRLHFRDPRKFGRIEVIDDVDDFIAAKGLGPDALEIGDNAFADAIGRTRGAVKSALLSQKKLAGIGNLWSDEALYRTGIDPDARGSDLTQERIGTLHRATREILQSVVDTGATYSKLPDDWLIHRRDDGAACTRCDGTITKKKVGGRTSYHCPDHQTGT
ncbi:DNA-formamidopyrimidine glycosylase [Sulfitobacter alexandrii]|uniref:DNA-formamidopyrimidine glycosylase n=1 Tax=Sulfitobacter alexandrii TaxID=1917485 RepID=A0A1J0WK48_9RHOB|nr:DNA-formamidopyrimidine glycosylase family protein [Sulfitobacter alexandrii]APE44645.1 DNA-formamidopyrimidine glycosylase [Sulfitobacter alexandrii]